LEKYESFSLNNSKEGKKREKEMKGGKRKRKGGGAGERGEKREGGICLRG